MAPEHDDDREHQLAALRRYVSDLDVRGRQPAGQDRPAPERRRAAWPWLLATVTLMAVALAAGMAIGGRRDPAPRPAPGVAAAPSTSVAAPTATPECAEAVRRANESIGHAVKLAGALREHTAIMNRLLNGQLTLEAARKAGTPSLIAGSAEAARFDVALAAYKQVVDRCRSGVP